MFRPSKGAKIKARALSTSALALRLAQDRRFRKRLVSAVERGSAAGRRTRRSLGLTGAGTRLASDQALRADLRGARDDLQRAYERLDAKKRRHRLRRFIVLAGLTSLAGVPQIRKRAVSALSGAAKHRWNRDDERGRSAQSAGGSSRPRSLDEVTKEELDGRGQGAGISGRAEVSKDELVQALRARR